MRSILRVGLFGLGVTLGLSTALALPQNTVYVDSHAASGGNGSAAAPFRKIQDAIDAPHTQSGDTVLVAPGVYVGRVEIDRPLTVRSSHGPLSTVIRAAVGQDTVNIMSGSLEGFTVVKKNGAGDARVVTLSVATNIRRCIVLGAPMLDGIAFTGSGTVSHCLVSECGEALRFFGYPGGRISNSILRNNSHPSQAFPPSPAPVFFEYCVVDSVVGPSTCFTAPPLLRSIASHDFHLRSTSPCIDAGDPNSPLDPDGSRADIGPLPFDPNWTPFEIYCTAKVNSLGCTPTIDAAGNASASAAVPFEITCSNTLNQRSGLLFYGYGPRATAYQGGYLCVASPVRRTALLNSGGSTSGTDCSGVFSFDFNAHIQSGADALLEPGVEVFAQFWSRDSDSSFNNNRSDAVRFVVLP